MGERERGTVFAFPAMESTCVRRCSDMDGEEEVVDVRREREKRQRIQRERWVMLVVWRDQLAFTSCCEGG